jgi:integrase
VFASPTAASARITEPRAPHAEALADAGIPHVSIHGLRRSFALSGKASGAPAGAIAQVMGHKPSANAERYKPRPIDALRGYLARVETFILDRAGIAFDRQMPRRVAGAWWLAERRASQAVALRATIAP